MNRFLAGALAGIQFKRTFQSGRGMIDRGGIPKDAQDRIFEAFWQLDGSITREVNRGVGLGLSIVKSYVETHDGRLEFESEEGRGTTFSAHIPLTLG